jgi:hypothetical protein
VGYIQANLLPDEEILYKARLHWIIFSKCCALVFLGAIFVDSANRRRGGHPDRVVWRAVADFGLLHVGVRGDQQTGDYQNRISALKDLGVTPAACGNDFSRSKRCWQDSRFRSVTLTGSGGVKEMFDNISAPLEFRRRIQGEAT